MVDFLWYTISIVVKIIHEINQQDTTVYSKHHTPEISIILGSQHKVLKHFNTKPTKALILRFYGVR